MVLMEKIQILTFGEELAGLARCIFADSFVTKIDSKSDFLATAARGGYVLAIIPKNDFPDNELREFQERNFRKRPLFWRYENIARPFEIPYE
jgi:hypothetical protein